IWPDVVKWADDDVKRLDDRLSGLRAEQREEVVVVESAHGAFHCSSSHRPSMSTGPAHRHLAIRDAAKIAVSRSTTTGRIGRQAELSRSTGPAITPRHASC